VFKCFTEGIILCKPLQCAVKVAKEMIDMVQVGYHAHLVAAIRLVRLILSILQQVRKNRDGCAELAQCIYILICNIVKALKGVEAYWVDVVLDQDTDKKIAV
jgi:hypothetical protein